MAYVIKVRESPLEEKEREQDITFTVPIKASYWNALYIPLILGISILTTSILTLIPRHNSMAYPEYWFEMAIILVLVFSTTSTISYVTEVFIYMDLEYLASVNIVTKHFLRTLIAFGIPYGILCFGWTNFLQYNHPMPFLGYAGLISWILTLPFVWFLIPPHLRKMREYKKKTIMYILYSIFWMMITIQKMSLSILFETLPEDFQFLMSIFVPICRFVDSLILSKLVTKISGNHNQLANIFLNVSIYMDFAVFVAVMLASANNATVYSILGVEFMLHLKACYHIIRSKTRTRTEEFRNEVDVNKESHEIEEVILSETIEALIPLAYAANFATAYYGPNSMMIGNVRAAYWAFKEVEDPGQLYFAMALMFLVDVGCIVATGCTFWISCKINIIQKFLEVMKKYWWLLVIKLAASGTSFLPMFAQNDINTGCDFTFKFEWITLEGRLNLIQNATDLINEEKMLLLA